jgi:hypothetical protein
MSERTIGERRDWISDIVWVVLYSILVFLLMLHGQRFRREATFQCRHWE